MVGGLRNRAPTELVEAMMRVGNAEAIISGGEDFLKANAQRLNGLVAEGKGVQLGINQPVGIRELGELVVRQKLAMLKDQIGAANPDGTIWPALTNGFADFWNIIQQINERGKVRLDTAVISSGHDKAIEDTFRAHGLNQPDLMITDDDIRGMDQPRLSRLRNKPGPLTLGLAYRDWRKIEGFAAEHNNTFAPIERAGQIAYFGDDPKKDILLGQRSQVTAGLFKEGETYHTDRGSGVVTFGNWRSIGNVLVNHEASLRQGVSLRNIFISNGIGIENITHRGGVER